MTEEAVETERKSKFFQLREVPEDLHHAWKVVAAFEGKSMEDIALEAIKNFIKGKLSEYGLSQKTAGEIVERTDSTSTP